MITMMMATARTMASAKVERVLKDGSTLEDKMKMTVDMDPPSELIRKSSFLTMVLPTMTTKEGEGEWPKDDQRKDDVLLDVVINLKYDGNNKSDKNSGNIIGGWWRHQNIVDGPQHPIQFLPGQAS